MKTDIYREFTFGCSTFDLTENGTSSFYVMSCCSTPHVSARPHGRGHPGAPCRPLRRATETRAKNHRTRLDAALRNMSGNEGAAAPRNGLAAGRTATSAENRRNIVERASGGGKGHGIIVDPR